MVSLPSVNAAIRVNSLYRTAVRRIQTFVLNIGERGNWLSVQANARGYELSQIVNHMALIPRRQQAIRRRGFALSDDTFGYMSSVSPANSGDSNAQRRSQRVMVRISVMILAEGGDNKPVSEETRTVTVNAHGAMILLALKVSIGQLLTLRNLRTREEVLCRVVYLSTHQSEQREVGIDFVKPSPGFWHISFPPPDWTTQSPEAKGSTKQKK